jgi:two-component system NtrC family sensor kinase
MERFYLPLFWKFIVGTSAIIILLGGISVLLIWHIEIESLQEEYQQKGHYIASWLAAQAADDLISEDHLSLQQFIDNIKVIDSTVVYAFIRDESDNVIVHSFSNKLPEELIHANPFQEDQAENVIRVSIKDNSNRIVRDFAKSITNGNKYTIHVGLSEEGIHKEVKIAIQAWLITVGVILLVANLGAGIFAYFITHPVKAIIGVTENLTFSCLRLTSHPRVSLHKNVPRLFRRFFHIQDEMDVLAEKFNEMVDRLAGAYCELESTQANLIQSEKLASVGTLAAEIAHEINNPVAGLKNCIRRLQKDPKNILQNQKYLDMMEEAALKMESIVCGLLDYTRQEDMVLEEVKISQVIEKALLLISYKIEIYQIEIINSISADLPCVIGSFSHLEQVFINLLVNAINAINEICKVDTACRRQVFLDAEVLDSYLHVKVKDTGTGIPATAREKIFDPFYTTREIGVGTGLGLSICHNIIKSHNGDIKVDSQVGKGTVFVISLPLSVDAK